VQLVSAKYPLWLAMCTILKCYVWSAKRMLRLAKWTPLSPSTNLGTLIVSLHHYHRAGPLKQQECCGACHVAGAACVAATWVMPDAPGGGNECWIKSAEDASGGGYVSTRFVLF
jgi:hypothetical protein